MTGKWCRGDDGAGQVGEVVKEGRERFDPVLLKKVGWAC